MEIYDTKYIWLVVELPTPLKNICVVPSMVVYTYITNIPLISINIPWLVVSTPLKNIFVRQLG